MSLKLDLRGDFYKCVEKEVQSLKADGFKFSSKEKDVSYIAEFFNLIERIPVPRPRKILKEKTFSCPKELQKNLEVLENKIVNGEAITSYLSKKIIDSPFTILFSRTSRFFCSSLGPEKFFALRILRGLGTGILSIKL